MRFLLALAAAAAPLLGQMSGQMSGQLGSFDQPIKLRQYVSYVAESQTVPAGKHAELELRFHVIDGYHVNSHHPASDLLIPTALDLQAATGVKVGEAVYPSGQPYKVGDDTLDVYAGDFTVHLPVVAVAGEHSIDGDLKYQACNRAACYPGKTLHMRVLFTAR
jgi:DsbC/DsbD-like thiol-disulfide interchange protein